MMKSIVLRVMKSPIPTQDKVARYVGLSFRVTLGQEIKKPTANV